jgi:ABC-type multidrug transport system ATPase subunit
MNSRVTPIWSCKSFLPKLAAVSSTVLPVKLNLYAGDSILICANNGVGKTSLLRSIVLMAPYFGQIWYSGKRLQPSLHAVYLDQIAYQSSFPCFPQQVKGEEYLHWICALYHCEYSKLFIDRLGCAKIIKQKLGSLSTGQRQLFSWLIMLFMKRKIWILDEPFVHLDKDMQYLVTDLIIDHKKEGGILLFTGHQPLKESFVTRILFLAQGIEELCNV